MPFLGQTSTQPQQLGAFGLTQAALARLAGRGPGPEVVHPPAQRLLLEAELPGHSGDPRRVRPIMNILSYEVSTSRGQGIMALDS